MFRIISFFIWLLLITIPLIWFFNNNGWINITWLGYEVKIDILTFLLTFILVVGILFIIYRLFFLIISLILGFFGIFKTDELKKRDKIIKKYEDFIELITNYVQAANLHDLKEAKSWQKKIHSLLKNNDLKKALIEQISESRDIEKNKTFNVNSEVAKKKLLPTFSLGKLFRKNTVKDKV